MPISHSKLDLKACVQNKEVGETGEFWDTGNSGTNAILCRSYNLISTRITWNIVIVELHLCQTFHHECAINISMVQKKKMFVTKAG